MKAHHHVIVAYLGSGISFQWKFIVFYGQEHKYILTISSAVSQIPNMYSDASIHIMLKQSNLNYILKYIFLDQKAYRKGHRAKHIIAKFHNINNINYYFVHHGLFWGNNFYFANYYIKCLSWLLTFCPESKGLNYFALIPSLLYDRQRYWRQTSETESLLSRTLKETKRLSLIA